MLLAQAERRLGIAARSSPRLIVINEAAFVLDETYAALELEEQNKLSIRLASTRSRIVALPGHDPKTIRGFSSRSALF